MSHITEPLAEFAAGLRFENLPAEVLQEVAAS